MLAGVDRQAHAGEMTTDEIQAICKKNNPTGKTYINEPWVQPFLTDGKNHILDLDNRCELPWAEFSPTDPAMIGRHFAIWRCS